MNRNFFICSVGEKNKDYSDENLKRCIDNNAHYMHKNTTHKGVFGNVKENDVVILKYADDYIAFGMVTKKNDDDKIFQDWSYAIYVKQWYFHNNTNKKKGVSRYGVQSAIIEGDQYATIKQITAGFAKNRMIAIAGKDNELIKMIEKEQNMAEGNNNIMSLLSSNHNLILTGAPGTGKTYLAKQIAQQMIFGEIKEKMTDEEQKQFDEQCDFVQFHPSYDYTDFVEGLRPKQNNGNVGFELKDGVFKEFCAKATRNFEDSKKTKQELIAQQSFEDKYNVIINMIKDGNITKFDLKSKGANMEVVDVSNRNSILLRFAGTTTNRTYTVSFKRISVLARRFTDVASLDNMTNIYDSIQGVIKGCNASAYWAVLKKIYEQNELESKESSQRNKKEELRQKVQEKPYVFIIDEINRGEISKIFGELFFSIDPGYRGTDGKVKTQYQNLVDEDDEFYEGFFVPKNVYIIGTMNDIDRSVESMDFAFRRRFAFKEIKAMDRVEMLYDNNNGIGSYADDAKERMSRLNKEIEKIEGLSTAYHIGPAYFLKLKNYNGNFQQLWENHLDGLLREYLRGMQNLEEKLKTLKAAYDNESDSANGQ